MTNKPVVNVTYEPHALTNDLVKHSRKDQVANIFLTTMTAWLDCDQIWPGLCETRYDRNVKGNQVTFSIFSNALSNYGLENSEKPFFQIEVDRYTKKPQVCKDIPLGFGISKSVFDHEMLRDMAFPFLHLTTLLLGVRLYVPINVYGDEGVDRPLQLEIVGSRCVWRIMLWQNRLIQEYNQLVKLDQEKFYTPPDGTYNRIKENAEAAKNKRDRIMFDYENQQVITAEKTKRGEELAN